MKKILALGLAVLLIVSVLAVSVSAEEGEENDHTYYVRIEGVSANLYNGMFTVNTEAEKVTAKDLFVAMDSQVEELTFTGLNDGYISSVNGETAGTQTDKGWDGWMFRVNGEAPDVGIADFALEDYDEVVLYYSDEFNTGMQFPQIDGSMLTFGVLHFYSLDTEYDEQSNPVVKNNPVQDMTVIVDGVEYKTSEAGNITLNAAQRTTGSHTIQVSRKADNGLETVLRFAPDTEFFVEDNPHTGDSVAVYVVLGVLSLLTLAGTAVVARKKGMSL